MLNRTKIALKIMAPVVGQAFLLVSLIGVAFWLQGNVDEANRKASSAFAKALEASDVRALSRAIQRDALKLTIEAWTGERKNLETSINKRGEQLLAKSRDLSETAKRNGADLSRDFVGLQETVVKEINAVKASALSNNLATAIEEFKARVEPAERTASQVTDRFIAAGEEEVRLLTAEASRVQASARLIILSVGIAAVIVGLGASAMVAYGGIIFPLRRVMASMARVSAGDHASPIEGLERQDEIGDVAKAVSVIRDASIERARLESEATEQRAARERERERVDAERRQNEAAQMTVVGTLADSLAKIAGGDLSERIDAEFTGRFQQIKTDFNAAIAKLEDTIHRVVASAGAITCGSQEIATASVDLSRRNEQQAASLEETAAALGEITATVGKTAEGTKHARAVVAEARDDAEKSGDIVRNAVDAMGRIEKSSKEISQIIGVIDEIAFQTNLLALNAGVEAARAGETGRGFAVVASEVRALAQRSTDAAKDIKLLITSSNSEVANGVRLVGGTGDSLARIVVKVSEINSIVGEIAARAEDQATGLQQINTAINQMDQVTQQNAAMAEEATAASRSLLQETRQLSGLLSEFQISPLGDGEGRSLRRELQRASPHAFRSAASA